LDRELLQTLNRDLAAPWLDTAMSAVSWLYGPGIVVPVLLAVLVLRRPWKDAWRGPAAVAAAGLVCVPLKIWIARPRPAGVLPDVRVVGERLLVGSMPSGHTAAAFALGMWLLLEDRRLGVPALVAAILVGVSRVYMGAHWPTDVLAGALLGALVAAVLAPPRRGSE